jgi:hypothetical protein
MHTNIVFIILALMDTVKKFGVVNEGCNYHVLSQRGSKKIRAMGCQTWNERIFMCMNSFQSISENPNWGNCYKWISRGVYLFH